jgi:hypothetical protein
LRWRLGRIHEHAHQAYMLTAWKRKEAAATRVLHCAELSGGQISQLPPKNSSEIGAVELAARAYGGHTVKMTWLRGEA